MISEGGMLRGPYLQVLATTHTHDPTFDDCRNRPVLRQNGTFYAKVFETIALNPYLHNHIACTRATLDIAILNFDSELHHVEGVATQLHGKHHIDNVQGFISAMNGTQKLAYDANSNRCRIQLQQGETLELSDDAANVLGFTETHFKANAVAQQPPDLYKQFRPLVITTEVCEPSFMGDVMAPVLCVLDMEQLLPHSNTRRTINIAFDQDRWCHLTQQLQLYIRLRICTAGNQSVAFAKNTDITLQLHIRSTSYQLV